MTPVGGIVVLECVVNVSEGRDERRRGRHRPSRVGRPARRAQRPRPPSLGPDLGRPGPSLEEAVRAVARADGASASTSARHDGVHPRLGALDVVPFVPARTPTGARRARRRPRPGHRGPRPVRGLGRRRAGACPASSTGPSGRLPEVRREAFGRLAPDTGPPRPHPQRRGVCRGGALRPGGLQRVARRRPTSPWPGPSPAPSGDRRCGPWGWRSAGATQVSCNLIDPWWSGPAAGLRRRAPAGRASRHRGDAGRARGPGARRRRRRPSRRTRRTRARPRSGTHRSRRACETRPS